MPTYKPFSCNSEVIDVFSCVVDGKITVKEIMKKLRQPQSTVSEKLRFLVENNVIIKDKWKFNPNWKTITKIFQREVRKQFEEPLELTKSSVELAEAEKDLKDAKNERNLAENIRNVMDDVPNIFNERRVKRIVEEYADSLSNYYLNKLSLSELAELYISTLERIDTSEFKNFGKDITRIKILFNDIDIRDMEETLFMTVEGELNDRKD